MYRLISENAGFYKLEKDGIKYNVSAKKFAVLKSNGEIESVGMKDVTPKEIDTPKTLDAPIDNAPSDSNTPSEPSLKDQLMAYKKAELAELAARNGFTDEITSSVTKEILADFIIANTQKGE